MAWDFLSRSLQGAALIPFNNLEENIKSLLIEFAANKKKIMKREEIIDRSGSLGKGVSFECMFQHNQM